MFYPFLISPYQVSLCLVLLFFPLETLDFLTNWALDAFYNMISKPHGNTEISLTNQKSTHSFKGTFQRDLEYIHSDGQLTVSEACGYLNTENQRPGCGECWAFNKYNWKMKLIIKCSHYRDKKYKILVKDCWCVVFFRFFPINLYPH